MAKSYVIRKQKPEVTIVNNEKVSYQDRLRPQEQDAILKMNGAWLLLDESMGNAEIRLKKLGVYWMYKGMLGCLKKLCRIMEASAEPEQYKTLALRCKNMRSYVTYEKVNNGEEGTWFLTEYINTIAMAALESTCELCTKKGNDARNCPLQKALRACTSLPDDRIIDGCMFKPYTDANYFGLLDETEDLAL